MSETDKLLKEISGKMDLLMRLVAADIVKMASVEQDKIELLDSFGFRPVEIAQFLNKTPGNINVQLNLIRKKRASKTKMSEKVRDSKDKPAGNTESAANLSRKRKDEQK